MMTGFILDPGIRRCPDLDVIVRFMGSTIMHIKSTQGTTWPEADIHVYVYICISLYFTVSLAQTLFLHRPWFRNIWQFSCTIRDKSWEKIQRFLHFSIHSLEFAQETNRVPPNKSFAQMTAFPDLRTDGGKFLWARKCKKHCHLNVELLIYAFQGSWHFWDIVFPWTFP